MILQGPVELLYKNISAYLQGMCTERCKKEDDLMSMNLKQAAKELNRAGMIAKPSYKDKKFLDKYGKAITIQMGPNELKRKFVKWVKKNVKQ